MDGRWSGVEWSGVDGGAVEEIFFRNIYSVPVGFPWSLPWGFLKTHFQGFCPLRLWSPFGSAAVPRSPHQYVLYFLT